MACCHLLMNFSTYTGIDGLSTFLKNEKWSYFSKQLSFALPTAHRFLTRKFWKKLWGVREITYFEAAEIVVSSAICSVGPLGKHPKRVGVPAPPAFCLFFISALHHQFVRFCVFDVRHGVFLRLIWAHSHFNIWHPATVNVGKGRF